jgi:hypothetical protein
MLFNSITFTIFVQNPSPLHSFGFLPLMPDGDPEKTDRRMVELRQLAGGDQPGAIEFALMLDRAIEAFRSDPEMLRGAVYELARTKLRQQLDQSNPEQAQDVLKSLEIAIGKVETFSQSQPALLFKPSDLSGNGLPRAALPSPEIPQVIGRRAGGSRATWIGYVLALLIAAAAMTAVLISRGLLRFPTESATAFKPAATNAASEASPAVSAPPPAKRRPMPATYGAFAVVGENFVELEPVGIRPPDIRVAVSTQLKLPERAALKTTTPTFMVYERFPPSVARAEARVMAKIFRVFGGDNAEPTWVIRNMSTPFRVVMDSERTDVLMVSPNADVELKPGRYALVVGTNAYDFTIAGTADSATHCLEQIVATNGTFYSPCK